MSSWRSYDVAAPKRVAKGRSPIIFHTTKRLQSDPGPLGIKEDAEVALLKEYIRAGAAKNMLPLCWRVDGITTRKPHLCRRTARRGKQYCKFHASLEEA